MKSRHVLIERSCKIVLIEVCFQYRRNMQFFLILMEKELAQVELH